MPKKKGFNEYVIDGDMAIITLRQREGKEKRVSIIDTEELEKLIKIELSWHPQWFDFTQSYYASATEYYINNDGERKQTTRKLHNIIMNTNEKIDHKNHDTLDNRKENLRIISVANNGMNRKSKNKNNKSGYRNVFWSTGDNAWLVALQVEGKQRYFGRFKLEDVHLAGICAEEARQRIYKEFAGLN